MQSGLLQTLFIICGVVASFPATTHSRAHHANVHSAAITSRGTILSPAQHDSPLPQFSRRFRSHSKRYVGIASVSPRSGCTPRRTNSIAKSRRNWSTLASGPAAVASSIVEGFSASTAPFLYPSIGLPTAGFSMNGAFFGSAPASVAVGTGGAGATGGMVASVEGSAGSGVPVTNSRAAAVVTRRAEARVIGKFLPNYTGQHQVASAPVLTPENQVSSTPDITRENQMERRSLSHASGIIPTTLNAGAEYIGATVNTLTTVLGV